MYIKFEENKKVIDMDLLRSRKKENDEKKKTDELKEEDLRNKIGSKSNK